MEKSESHSVPTTHAISLVAVYAHDNNIRDSLVAEIADISGGNTVLIVMNDDDWSKVGDNERRCAFVDFACLSPITLAALATFQNVIIFNCNAGPIRDVDLSALREDSGPVLFTEDSALTGLQLREKYKAQVSENQLNIGNGRVQRSRPGNEASSGSGIRDRAAVPNLDKFLNFIREGIYEQPDRLKELFVNSSTRTKVPSAQTFEFSFQNIDAVEQQLREFVTGESTNGEAVFLVGKRGTGKSTLAYHVADELQNANKVYYAAVDYTMQVSTSTINTRLEPILKALRDHNVLGIDAGNTEGGYPLSTIRKSLAKSIADSSWDNLGPLPPESVSLIRYEQDRGLITRMYCYYEYNGRQPEQVAPEYPDQGELIREAEEWYDRATGNIRELFVKYAFFLFTREGDDEVSAFSYRQIILHILSNRDPACEGLRVLREAASKFAATKHLSKPSGDGPSAFIDMAWRLPLVDLRSWATECMRIAANGRPLLLLLDNIDQRTSADLETELINGAVSVYKKEVRPHFEKCHAIIAMRDSTCQTNYWLRADPMRITQWMAIGVLPPDLAAVLRKRCKFWLASGTSAGEQDDVQFVQQICSWVIDSCNPDNKNNDRPILISIIQNRHPFNVRDQLKAFVWCARNALWHDEASRKLPSVNSLPAWTHKQYEFFLQVFLEGDSGKFSEDRCKIPNIFDNGFGHSPYNACIRSWILQYVIDRDQVVSRGQILEDFSSILVPYAEMESAIDALYRYDVLVDDAGNPDKLITSIWGKYFADNIAYDLPYISTVWWATSMDTHFSIGQPRVVQPSELRGLSGQFANWIKYEERIANAALPQVKTEKITKVISGLPRIYVRIHTKIAHSINKIERADPKQL